MGSMKSLIFLFWGFCLIVTLEHVNSLKTKSNSKGNRNSSRPNYNSSKPEQALGFKGSPNESTPGLQNKISSRILQIRKGALENDFTVISKPFNSDLIVGVDVAKDARIILECSSQFQPVQWIYTGQGMPEISTNTSIKGTKKARNSGQFTATAALGFNRNLQESDTGEYICRSVQDPEESIHYFIYVPGKSLFTSTKGRTIQAHESQNVIRIPCSVTHPDVLVTLQTKVNGFLQCPAKNAISFSPKTGFTVNIAKAVIEGYRDEVQDDPSGDYVCIAGLNGTFQMLEYSVKRAVRIGGIGALLHSDLDEEDFDDSLEDKNIFRREEDECFENPCGRNSICRMFPGNKLPVCRCKFGYNGSPPNCQPDSSSVCSPSPCGPNSRCQEIPGRKGTKLAHCSCLPAYIGRPPNCVPECLLNLDCPVSMACINQQCEDPCDGHCGQGAGCKVRDHVPVCYCPSGYSGDPSRYGKCGKIRTPSQSYFPSRPGYPNDPNRPDESSPPDSEINHSCEPWPCGPFSECRPVGDNAHCSCAPGYIGIPPNCRPQCRKDVDCPKNRACIESKCRDPCIFTRMECGSEAECFPRNHRPECQCRAGFYGNPHIRCTQQGNDGQSNHHQGQGQGPINGHFPESPSSSEEYAPPPSSPSHPPSHNMRPVVVGAGYPGSSKPSDKNRPTVVTHRPPSKNPNPNNDFPCRKSPCGKNALCSFRNQTVGCKCPAELTGFGSDPYVECLPSNNPCEICGPLSECRVRKNRQPICSCLPGKTGSPPNCRETINCRRNGDCPQTEACQKRMGICIDPCLRADCGQNSVCKGVNHQPVCACPNAPDKDPLFGCPPEPVHGSGGKFPLGASGYGDDIAEDY